MAFDQSTRNRLQKFVSNARAILGEEFTRQLQATYGLDPKQGTVAAIDSLTHLDNRQRQTAHLLRETLAHYLATTPGKGEKDRTKQVLDRIVREQAFTVLNRLAALRMAEARGFLLESIAKAHSSKGFQLYRQLSGTAHGETGDAYRNYLFSLFDEFSLDLAVLFDRHSAQGRLFPRESALLELLGEINHVDIEPLWAEDETIGWIYQYFNSQEERKKMRAESQAPRNSRELAVRNQFFTPRYVVEFLTDNTLGRIWYEMTQGNTALVDNCRYLVRRPTEIFLKPGETAPKTEASDSEALSQEELLKQPVYIPHRPLKDPRSIRMLDPACGSMHFGLYAFDLFECIYLEAWQLEQQLGPDAFTREAGQQALQSTFESLEAFKQQIPKLIIEHNIHGVDIDPRAVQIAGLSLWQRAQRAWHQQGIKPQQRPTIVKSNIVCAEPMPGEKALLQEFTSKLNPPVLGQLLEVIFDKMQLAGEAGTLLKIEEEIQTAIHEAREQWLKQSGSNSVGDMFQAEKDAATPQAKLGFDLSGVDDETFWDDAEQRILQALSDYADQAESNADQKRLFADDAAKGFAFIDLCRKRFDVVLMNPPFGLATKSTKTYFEKAFKQKRLDFAACFISRFAPKSSFLAGITTRNIYFLSSYADWRLENLIDADPGLSVFADLGAGVLDGAMVEAALAILSDTRNTQTSFIRADTGEEKSTAIQNAVQNANSGELDSLVKVRDRNIFRKLPTNGLSYWADEQIINLFDSVSSFEEKGNEAWVGLQTNDDFQWVRLSWEIPIKFLHSGRSIGEKYSWVPYAKGGEYMEYFPDIHLVVQWGNDGRLIKTWKTEQFRLGLITENNSKCWNESKYFERGITWSQRSQIGLSVRALPEGCVFGIKGPAAFTKQMSSYEALCVFNSEIFKYLVSLQMAFGSYDTGVIRRTPYPQTGILSEDFQALSKELIRLSSLGHRMDECHRLFDFTGINPDMSIDDAFKSNIAYLSATANRLGELKGEVESSVQNIYDISNVTIDGSVLANKDGEIESQDEEPVSKEDVDLNTYTSSILSALVGCVLGRWDVRYATRDLEPAPLPDPFDPLPICSPAMLQNSAGLPAVQADVPSGYPIQICWPGILVDDEAHSLDIVRRVRECIELIWKRNAEIIEQEACGILGLKSLRDYFQRPSAFFAQHLKVYSKSRRSAPIYWPLQTPSGSYTLWVYYHRLNEQTLYTCVNDFVEPKLQQVEQDLNGLRSKSARSSQEEKELEKLSDLASELRDFRDELLRLAKFWKPNLNDGVQITAAPLWKLFQHKAWQKKLKETWESLEKGDYDWAHLACSIWPERVLRKCHQDRSLAIAHDVEDHFWHEVEVPVKRGKKLTGETKLEWQPKDLSEAELSTLVKQLAAEVK